MSLRLACGAALSVFLLGGGQASATGVEPVAVLGIEALAAPESLASSATAALRRALEQRPGVQPMPGKDLVELRFLFGCQRESELATCLSQAGTTLVVDKIVVGTLRGDTAAARRGSKLELELRLLDVQAGRWAAGFVVLVDPQKLAPPAVNGLAAVWLARLLTGEEAPLADLDRSVARPAGSPAFAAPVSASTRGPSKRRVLVVSGATALGVAGALAAVAIGGFRYYSDEKDKASTDLGTLAGLAPGYLAQNRAWFDHATCTPPAGAPAGAVGVLDDFSRHCENGQSWAAATTGLWVVAGLLAAGGATALGFGLREPATVAAGRALPRDEDRSALRLSLVPRFDPRLGAAEVRLEMQLGWP